MEKTPSLSDLEYFQSIVSEGSITGAARKLRIQQSSLTVAVKRLELIAGATLLVRTRAGVQTTQAGKKLLEGSKNLLDQWYALTRDLKGKEKVVRSRLSLGCHQTTGLYSLKQFLPNFLNSNPSIEVTVQHNYAPHIIEKVLSYQLDFGLAVNPTRHQDLTVLPLYKTYIGLWGSNATSKLNEGILLTDPFMYGLELVMYQLEQNKFRFERYLSVESLDTIASLVVSGAGNAILPADTACNLGPSPLKLLWKPKMPELTVCLIFRKELQQSEGSRIFIDGIQEALGKLSPGKKHRSH